MMTQPALAPTAVPDPATPIASGASGSRAKRRVHFAAALGLAIFFAIFDTLMNFPLWIGPPVNRALMLEWLGFNLVVCLAFGPPLFVAALAAEGATSRGVPYVIAWGTAALSACAFATALQWLVLDRVFDWSVFVPGQLMPATVNYTPPLGVAAWTRQEAIYVFLTWSIMAMPVTLLYARWRRAVDVRERLHAAEMRRSQLEREMLEARLQATRARVEPRFLLDTLAGVKALHPSDPRQAMAQLDSLIGHLRAVLPRLRDS